MTVLLPGGAGYIGSHTAVELLESGYDVVIIDDFSNSNKKAIDNIKKITGKNLKFYEVDYRNKEKLKLGKNMRLIRYVRILYELFCCEIMFFRLI